MSSRSERAAGIAALLLFAGLAVSELAAGDLRLWLLLLVFTGVIVALARVAEPPG